MVNTTKVHRQCLELVAAIEELRAKRQVEVKSGLRAPQLWRDTKRTFSYTQFRNEVYGSWPDMLRGTVKSPPPRETVLEIARYLDCDIQECNRLLRAAGYALLPAHISGEELRHILHIAEDVIRCIGLPSCVIHRNWDVLMINENMIKLIGATIKGYNNGILEKHTIIHVEQRFQEKIKSWMQIDEIRCYRERAKSDHVETHEVDPPPSFSPLIFLETDQGHVNLRTLRTTLGHFDYPLIMSLIPADAHGWKIYHALNIPAAVACLTYR